MGETRMGSIFFFTKKSIEKNLPKSVGQRSWTFCGSIWEHKADLIRLAIVAHVSDLVPRLLVCVCSHVHYRERGGGGGAKRFLEKLYFIICQSGTCTCQSQFKTTPVQLKCIFIEYVNIAGPFHFQCQSEA